MISSDKKLWITDLQTDDSENIYIDWRKRIQSLSYTFKRELSLLNEDFDSNLIVVDGQHPPLLDLYIKKQVSIESLIIFDGILNIFSYWDQKIGIKILWNGVYYKSTKYKPFLDYDMPKFKKLILEHFE